MAQKKTFSHLLASVRGGKVCPGRHEHLHNFEVSCVHRAVRNANRFEVSLSTFVPSLSWQNRHVS